MEREIRLSRKALDRAGAIIRLRGKLTATEVHTILTDEGIDCPPIPVLATRMQAWDEAGAYEAMRAHTRRAFRPRDN